MLQREHLMVYIAILSVTIFTGCGAAAVDGLGDSGTVTEKTNIQELLPEAPYGLTVYTTNFSLPYLSWQDGSVNESGFRIERKTGGSGAYEKIAEVSSDTTSYSDTTVETANVYYYKVQAFNANGDSSYTASVLAIVKELKTKAPSPPSNLTATAVSNSEILIQWQDNSDIEDGFAIEMGMDELDMQVIDLTPPNSVSYNLAGLPESTCCFFKVKAFNVAGDSTYSNIAVAETALETVIVADEFPSGSGNGQMIGVTIPNSPVNLSASAVSEGHIDITWDDNSTGETGFSIERKAGYGTAFAEVAVLTPNTELYSDTDIEEAAYYYRIRAFNPAGWSAYSNIAVATTIPKTPSVLSIIDVTGAQVTVSWQDKSKVETGFVIERKAGSQGVFNEAGTVYANTSTFTDAGLDGLTAYSYRVKAYNASGYSGYSNIAEAVTLEAPQSTVPDEPVAGGDDEESVPAQSSVTAPEGQTILSAAVVSDTEINLAWQDNFSDEEGYRIEMSVNGIDFFQTYSSDANVSGYACIQLNPSTGYYFRIKAYNSAGESGYSNIAYAVTTPLPAAIPDAPSNLSASVVLDSRIDLNWQDNSQDEDGFVVETSTDGAFFYITDITGTDVAYYSCDGLESSTVYYFRVKAFNASGESGYSDTADALTPGYITGICDYSQVKAANGLYVYGNYAYVTDYNTGLKIINITDPAVPVLAGSYDTAGTSYDVFVEGDYAYIADGGAGLQIFDITNPAMPVWAGSLDTQWDARSVFVSNGNAFIASGDGGLCIADVTDSSNPAFAGFCDTPGTAEDVCVSGDYAYVADGAAGLQVIDVSNTPTLSIVGSYDTEGWAYGVSVSGGFAYVADGTGGLQILDTNDPANPVWAGAYGINGVAHGVYAFGSYIYIACEESGLFKINVSEPASAVLAGFYDTTGKSLAVCVSGNYTYLSDWNMGLVVLDTTDPAGPAIVGSHDTFGWAYDVFFSEYYAYVADGDFGLQIFDVSNYSKPVLKGSYSTPGWAVGVYVAGQYAYLSVQEFGLCIVDVSDKANPVLKGFCDTPGWAYNTYVSGNYAYVADWNTGLQIIDITDPAVPFIAAGYDTPGNAYSVAVSGNYACVADNGYGLLIIDVSEPAAPVLAGEYVTASIINEICVNIEYAYMACGVEGLLVLDISEPANPVLTGSFNTASEASGISISGGKAYIADGNAGLQIIDVADPASPVITGSLDTTGSARGVFTAGDYTFIADYNAGLKIIE